MVGKKGVVLLSVIILLLTIALIGASLVVFFASVSISARALVDEAKALYIAEAGIAQGIEVLRGQAGSDAETEASLGPTDFSQGTYEVKIDLEQSLITSIGIVHGIKKTIQLQYGSL